MNEDENGVSWLHRFASLIAVMAFLLLMTGLLASNAGSAAYALHGAGVGASGNAPAYPPGKYVLIYRLLAVALSVLTVLFALLLRRSNSRHYLKTLGSITLAVMAAIAVIVVGPVRRLFPSAESFACLGGVQIFFCLTVCLALFTRSDWRWDEPKTPDLASPSIRQILIFMTAAIFVQPFLGEGFRRHGMGIAGHFVLGIAVTLCSLWVLEMALTKYSHMRTFKVSAIFLAELVGLELFLGIVSYSMILNSRALPGSQPGLAVLNVTHAAVGTLVLAASLFTTFQAFKYFAPAEAMASSVVLHGNREAEAQED